MNLAFINRHNHLMFVYIHFKSRDHSPDKDLLISLAYFVQLQSYAIVAERTIILKLPRSMITQLEMGKSNLTRSGLWGGGRLWLL